MIHGSMSMGTAGIVCIVSMLIVFSVLLILYAATMIMGSVLGKVAKKPAAAKAARSTQAFLRRVPFGGVVCEKGWR